MPRAELVCRLCGCTFPANQKGAPRWYCDGCVVKTRALYFRQYNRHGGLSAGAVVKCRYCSEAELVYCGIGPVPTTCRECKRKQSLKRVQRFRERG